MFPPIGIHSAPRTRSESSGAWNPFLGVVTPPDDQPGSSNTFYFPQPTYASRGLMPKAEAPVSPTLFLRPPSPPYNSAFVRPRARSESGAGPEPATTTNNDYTTAGPSMQMPPTPRPDPRSVPYWLTPNVRAGVVRSCPPPELETDREQMRWLLNQHRKRDGLLPLDDAELDITEGDGLAFTVDAAPSRGHSGDAPESQNHLLSPVRLPIQPPARRTPSPVSQPSSSSPTSATHVRFLSYPPATLPSGYHSREDLPANDQRHARSGSKSLAREPKDMIENLLERCSRCREETDGVFEVLHAIPGVSDDVLDQFLEVGPDVEKALEHLHEALSMDWSQSGDCLPEWKDTQKRIVESLDENLRRYRRTLEKLPSRSYRDLPGFFASLKQFEVKFVELEGRLQVSFKSLKDFHYQKDAKSRRRAEYDRRKAELDAKNRSARGQVTPARSAY